MVDRNNNSSTITVTPTIKPIWAKEAEEAKLKSERSKTQKRSRKRHRAKAAFKATFKNIDSSLTNAANNTAATTSDTDDEEYKEKLLASKPVDLVDPTKCTAAGTGIAGGTACVTSTFTVVTKDCDGRKVGVSGAEVRVRVSPGVGGSDLEGIVKDMGDGSYIVSYIV